MKTQFVTDDHGKKLAVLLSLKEYKHILQELEELEDIRLYDSVKSRNEKRIPFDLYIQKRKKKKHA